MTTTVTTNSGVKVSRTSSSDIGLRGLFVVVDSGDEITLMPGESLELDLAPGTHTLLATNRLFTKRQEFIVSEGEQVQFVVSNKLIGGIVGILSAGLVIIAGTGPYRVTLDRAA